MNKILYITLLNPLDMSGLFHATLNRIVNNYQVYSILPKDQIYHQVLKKTLNKPQNYKKEHYKDSNTNTNINFLYARKNYLTRNFYLKDLDKIIRELKIVIKDKDINLIHAHWSYPQGYIARKLSEEMNIPFIVTYHGTDIHTLPEKNRFIKQEIINTLESASKNIFVSNYLSLYSNKLANTKRTNVIIPNGIDEEIFNLKRVESDKFVVVYVGRLTNIKNVNKLPKIFHNVQKELNDCVEFVIIGEGPLKKRLDTEFKAREVKVSFLGHLSQKKVAKQLNMSDVLILPSKKEGWPSVILEANACGVMVVGSQAGGIPEAMGDLGYAIPFSKFFEEKIARKIINLYKDGISRSELNMYGMNFTWDSIREKINEVYKDFGDK